MAPGPRPTVFGGDRPTTLRVPTTLEPDKLYPLIVVLHGYGVNGDIQTGYFGVRSLPLEGKALVDKIIATEIASDGMLKPGDGWGGTTTTYPDYFSPAYFRLFAQVSGRSKRTA